MALAKPRLDFNAVASPARDLAAALLERAETLSTVVSQMAANSAPVANAAESIGDALAAGRLVLICGNGGSAAEAQHFAGELVGRFRREREPWPALALTADAAGLTAIANDYGFETVFARQVAAFGRAGGVLVGISTSGESSNVINAAAEARQHGMRVIALTGHSPTRLGECVDIEIAVPATETALVQEVHTVLVHLISEIVESRLSGADRDRKDATS